MNAVVVTRLVGAIICFLAAQGCANAKGQTNGCGGASRGNAYTQSLRVELLPRPSEPAYYLYSAGFFILLTQNDALTHLKAHSERVGMGGLLPVMERQPLIESDTDLLSFALKDGSLVYSLNLLVADLLESGRASVIDVAAESGGHMEYITLRRISNRSGDFRRYCTPEGGLVFSVVDEIA